MTAQTVAGDKAKANGLYSPTDVPLSPLPKGWNSLASAFVIAARKFSKRRAISDSTGVQLTYRDTLIRSLALARALRRELGPCPFVGILVPPTVPAAVANLAVLLLGKIPVNLNYSAAQDVVSSSISQCGITHVITSGKVLSRFGLTVPNAVLLEEMPAKVSKLDKAWAAFVALAVPLPLLPGFIPGMKGDRLKETATVIFTSGSTGDPKGVVLSHSNILSNVHQIQSQINLLDDESVLGILPFFHSFGFTVTIWTVLCLGKRAVYHINPLDARIIGELSEKHGVTMMACTPTFFRHYLQRCKPEQFKTLKHLILGAEKLKPELAKDIQSTINVDPMEGYGCTETAPVAAVNVPHNKTVGDGRTFYGNRLGTVGTLVPGTSVKTLDPETNAELPPGTEGIIAIKGPQIMVGYLNKPEATAKVLQDGWYTTGDLGYLDADGFLRITDRLSRFSKIGGEMVPHLKVESALMEAAGVNEQQVAVTSVPDEKRGERLVVLHTPWPITPKDVCAKLNASGLPKLWLPGSDDFVEIEAIPVLPTGKVDLRRLKEIAREKVGY